MAMCGVGLYVWWVEGTGMDSVVPLLHQKGLIDLLEFLPGFLD